jgi:hypothetical protein
LGGEAPKPFPRRHENRSVGLLEKVAVTRVRGDRRPQSREGAGRRFETEQARMHQDEQTRGIIFFDLSDAVSHILMAFASQLPGSEGAVLEQDELA